LGLKRSAFESALRPGDRVLIDTSVLIAYLEPSDATHDAAAVLIDDFVKTGRNQAVISMVTVMEVLVRPMRVAPSAVAHIHTFLTQWPNVTLQSIDLPVAQEAASLRATHNIATPDALIIATGMIGQVSQLVTSDAAWAKKLASQTSRVRVCELRAFV
jgi:predicted nucleic acid-binding protein